MAWLNYKNENIDINIETLENGNLSMTLTEDGKEKLSRIKEILNNWNSIWEELLEYEDYTVIDPEVIGALTDSTIITNTDGIVYDEELNILSVDKVYWLPNYQVQDEFEDLANDKPVIFHLAKEYTIED